ncbi:MAG: hypothetical protein CMJ77_04505 [Planctomycetaceae bacterium]|nr:hypothetical protein [Planctomycetaceae bacterium]
MKLPKSFLLLPVLAFSLLLSPNVVQAAILIHDEAVSGDLSSDPANPSFSDAPNLKTLDIGTHVISGQAKNALDVLADPEYWTLMVAPQTAINAIRITEYENSSYVDPGEGGFFGVAEGTEMTGNNADTGNLIGGAIVGVMSGVTVGDDILQELAAGLDFGPFSISGFGSELGEGTYTFWFQEGNATPNTPPEAHPPGPNDANDFVDYTFEFDVVQVPEPSAATYFVSLILLGLTPHWRRGRKAQ